jgi:hypothetical protein
LDCAPYRLYRLYLSVRLEAFYCHSESILACSFFASPFAHLRLPESINDGGFVQVQSL